MVTDVNVKFTKLTNRLEMVFSTHKSGQIDNHSKMVTDNH